MQKIVWDSDYSRKNHEPKRLSNFGHDSRIMIWIFILANLVTAGNEFFSYQPALGLCFVAFQLAVVLALVLLKRIKWAIFLNVLFYLSGLEFSRDLISKTPIFSYRTVSIVGVSVGTIMVLLISVLVLMKYFFAGARRGTSRHLWFLSPALFAVVFYSASVGMTMLLGHVYTVEAYLSDMQLAIVLISGLALGLVYVWRDERSANLFTWLIVSILAARALVPGIMMLSGYIRGSYGGVPITSFSALDFYIPFLVFYDPPMEVGGLKILLFVCWVLGMYRVGYVEPSGKGIIICIVVLVLLGLKVVTKIISVNLSVGRKTFIGSAILVVLVIVILLARPSFVVTTSPGDNSILRMSKTHQVKSLMSFFGGNSLYSVDTSPQVRILELFNIEHGYAKAPLFAIFGEGWGGYFSDEAYPFPLSALGPGSYSEEEISTHMFFSPHESFNYVLLKYGFTGVFFWVLIMIKVLLSKRIKLFNKSVFVALWFITLGYSLSAMYLTGILLAQMLMKTKPLRRIV